MQGCQLKVFAGWKFAELTGKKWSLENRFKKKKHADKDMILVAETLLLKAIRQ